MEKIRKRYIPYIPIHLVIQYELLPIIVIPKAKRRSIHTGIKILVKQDAVPAHLLETLNPSQIWKYKNEEADKYYGNELFEYAANAERLLNHYSQHSFDRRVINGFLRMSLIIRNVFSSVKRFHKTLFSCRTAIVDAVERFNKQVSKSTIARILGISYQTLQNWILEERSKCAESLINVCKKYKPTQLASFEVKKIESLLQKQEFRFWPVCSVYYYALHSNLLNISLNTFYKYARLLNIKRLKPVSKKVYGISIRATRPNEYWHADVIKYRTEDGILNFIYVVIDNFSKKILNLMATGSLSAQTCKQSLEIAAQHASTGNETYKEVRLIVDGGSENVNTTVDEFLLNLESFDISLLVAQKQVTFSNSMVEAVNKIIRNSYLNHFEIYNLNSLQQKLIFVKENYNRHRPHGSLKGLTPEVAYKGIQVNTVLFKERIKSMRAVRKAINHREICGVCRYKPAH